MSISFTDIIGFYQRYYYQLGRGPMNVVQSKIKYALTHWGRGTHICVSKLTIIDSDNGVSPGRRQAIIWTNAGILLIRPLGTNFNEMLIEILAFSFMKMRLKVSSAKLRPFCLGLNVLSNWNCYWLLASFCFAVGLFGLDWWKPTLSTEMPWS